MRARFTDKTRRVVKYACCAAEHAGETEAGADDVLYGIAYCDEVCLATAILEKLEVSLFDFKKKFVPLYELNLITTIDLSDEFAELAMKEARDLNHTYVGTEHLLLAIVQSDSAASEYLRSAGLDHQRLLHKLNEFLNWRHK
jgi:ATP-dependent Clp protease ATP-binding subunit ClpC